ncbi:MAG: tRNA lysidine(34) synthetase TilS [Candidatus Binatia bacterium]
MSAAATFVKQVGRTIRRFGMLVPGDRVLVAVSGGPDSVALLAALAALASRLGIALRAAHLNHQLRGEESARDQRCAEAVAQRLGVPCIVGETAALSGRANLEARARAQRYAFLAQTGAEHRCNKIATGHTMDDQAETVLMRLLRGTGCDGLAGIRPVRDAWIVRPLIECSRRQVRAFLEASALPSCEDSTNGDRRFLRNRLRHDVLPLLRSINPRVTRSLASVAEMVAAESDLLDTYAQAVLAALPSSDGTLPVPALLALPAGLRARVVRAWLRQQRGDLQQMAAAPVRAVIELAQGGRPNGRVRLPAAQMVRREYDRLLWDRCEQAAAEAVTVQQLVPGSAVQFESGWCVSAEVVSQPGRTRATAADLWELVADAETVATPLVVRCAQPGDRIQPLGMRGRRKLQDIFVDRKLPRAVRWSRPVVESNGEILWVPGVVRSNAALVTGRTRSLLRLAVAHEGIAGRWNLC